MKQHFELNIYEWQFKNTEGSICQFNLNVTKFVAEFTIHLNPHEKEERERVRVYKRKREYKCVYERKKEWSLCVSVCCEEKAFSVDLKFCPLH